MNLAPCCSQLGLMLPQVVLKLASCWLKLVQVDLMLAHVGSMIAMVPQVDSSWCQVGLKLVSSWAQVGSRWPHVDSKWCQKSFLENMSKNITFRRASETVFDRFWRPRWPPGEGQNFHFWILETVLEPSWPLGRSRSLSIRIV